MKKIQTDLTQAEIDHLDAHYCFLVPSYGPSYSARALLLPKKASDEMPPRDEPEEPR